MADRISGGGGKYGETWSTPAEYGIQAEAEVNVGVSIARGVPGAGLAYENNFETGEETVTGDLGPVAGQVTFGEDQTTFTAGLGGMFPGGVYNAKGIGGYSVTVTKDGEVSDNFTAAVEFDIVVGGVQLAVRTPGPITWAQQVELEKQVRRHFEQLQQDRVKDPLMQEHLRAAERIAKSIEEQEQFQAEQREKKKQEAYEQRETAAYEEAARGLKEAGVKGIGTNPAVSPSSPDPSSNQGGAGYFGGNEQGDGSISLGTGGAAARSSNSTNSESIGAANNAGGAGYFGGNGPGDGSVGLGSGGAAANSSNNGSQAGSAGSGTGGTSNAGGAGYFGGSGPGDGSVGVGTGGAASGTGGTSNAGGAGYFGGSGPGDGSVGVGTGGASSTGSSSHSGASGRPIIFDLDGDGIEVTELSRSTIYVDAGGDGLLYRTAWADAGDGVLYYDPDNLNEIVERRQYAFTEWDPTATSDIEALAAVFDSNGDGVFDASDDAFSDFKMIVTNDDGSTTSKTLTELGITSINLTADSTHVELADGSVITGQTTFTRSDGTTGTVGDMLLAAEAQGHRVEQVESTDGSGNRVVDITAYNADGLVDYAFNSVTSPDGAQITNRYDDNGDGVTDRIQTINTVTQPDGSTIETETTLRGSDALTAVVQYITVTTVSADGLVETIERDSTGGGWFDQKEVRTTLADGSRTIDIDYLAQDGSVVNGISESVSIDGLNRVEAFDEDGDGAANLTITHNITINADDSRTESISATNADASLLNNVTEDVSADGRTKTIERDLDGDGDTDTREDLVITVNADDTTTSTLTVKNGNGSTRGTVTTDQSADALSRTTETDQDGDGDIDLKVVDATVINGDGSRENTVTQTNNDGSVRGMRKVTLGADKVSSETWMDLNQNGVFEVTDLVGSVTVDAVTEERTATDWMRNADGSVSAKIISVTSADGLQRDTTIDADGDGDTDTTINEDTSVNGAGIATKTIDVRNQDGTLRNSSTATTSSDGLTVTIQTDIDGDGTVDGEVVDASVLEVDDSTTRTVSSYAGNGTTLLSESVTTESADRRTTTTNLDADGDGVDDSITVSVEGTDGARTTTSTSYNADSSAIGQTVDTVSANGLEMTSETDFDGDLIADVKVETTTVLNADGSRT
ncbi:MAG: hypothetical protein GY789_21300, partial [Hyphomicrobiales bacterium]|nr:hypothetical protein [Hyphomicrobiales bacterium]